MTLGELQREIDAMRALGANDTTLISVMNEENVHIELVKSLDFEVHKDNMGSTLWIKTEEM